MKILASKVHPDEPCYGLYCGPRSVTMPDGTTEERLIEATYVIRGDAIAEYTVDYGPMSEWPDLTPVMYPSFGENRVGELQWLAERDRHDDKWARHRRELQEGSTLIRDILRQEEQKINIHANRSVFGPARSIERNGFKRKER